MSNAMTTLLVLLGFAAVAGLFVYLAVVDGRRWPRRLDAVLLPLGFSRDDTEAQAQWLAQRLRIVQPRHEGKRLLKHVYRRPGPDGRSTLFVCDYYFASAGGRARGGSWLLVCLVSSALVLPRFSIDTLPLAATGAAGRLFDAASDALPLPGLQRLSTGEDDLDQRLRVYTTPSQQGLPLSAELMRVLAATAGGTSLDAEGDTLVLTSIAMLADRVRGTLDSQKLLAMAHLAHRLEAALRG